MGGSVSRVWIAEKPSAAKDLAAGICLAKGAQIVNKGSSRADGYFALSSDDIVVPLHGHMIEPVFLREEHKRARREDFFSFLPVEVKDFEYQPKPETDAKGSAKVRGGKPVPSRQLGVVQDLLRRAGEIVNAGDIDREGQLIVDELLEFCGIDPAGASKPVWRLGLVSNREEDIAAQVRGLSERNGDPKWQRRRFAALARQHCDAALGFNASMAYQAVSGYARMSVGRVQSVVLNMVVQRDLAIERFKPVDYFVPVVTLADGTEMRFHKRADAQGAPGFDEHGRIVDEAVAKQICSLIGAGMKGRITEAGRIKQSEAAPLPYSASELASTVAKRTGMTPKQVESAAQSLYQRHKAISYVGTDCRYLPQSLLESARETMSSLSRLFPQQAAGADLGLRSAAWNDAKVEEHFAIVPTGKRPDGATEDERAVYEAVAKRYMVQFYPACESILHRLAAEFGRDEFRATRRETLRMGWKEVEGMLEQGGAHAEDASADDETEVDPAREKTPTDGHRGGKS